MPLTTLTLFIMAMLLVALLLEPLSRWIRLPLSAVLLAGGFAMSQLLVGVGLDTGLRWYHFHDLVFYVFLPALIFQSAFSMDARLLLRNLLPILLLALPVVLLSALLTATIVFLGIAHPSGFPWITALICGTLLAATDPVAVTETAARFPVPARLLTLMEGESLFNDATTIVLFMLLVASATGQAQAMDWGTAGLQFLQLTAGGLCTGALCGLFAWLMIRWINRCVVISLLAAYASYLLAEALLDVSGIMAALSCGLLVSHAVRHTRHDELPNMSTWWTNLGWIANSALFLLAGATFTLSMFEHRWLAMLLGIAAVLVSRWIGIWLTAGLVSRLPGQQTIPGSYRLLMSAGGLRGAVTLALVLSLPVELEGWWTVQSIAYGVVLFSMFAQAPAIAPLFKWLQRQGRL